MSAASVNGKHAISVLFPEASKMTPPHHRPVPSRPLVVSGLLALFALPTTSHAEGTIGLAIAQSSQPYRSYDKEALPAPILSWEGERLFLRGTSAGYRLWEGGSSKLVLSISPLLSRYRPEDSTDWRMRQLDDRRFLGVAGIGWRTTGAWGSVSAKAEAEVTGVGGVLGDLSYTYPLQAGAATLLPEVGATYQSKEMTRHYYGISRSESLRSGFTTYSPDESVMPYLGLTALVPLGKTWSATGAVRRTILSDTIKSSPMTNSNHMDTLVLGLSRRF